MIRSDIAYSAPTATRSCASNLAEAYPDSAAVPVPQPVNIFMTVEHAPDQPALTLGGVLRPRRVIRSPLPPQYTIVR